MQQPSVRDQVMWCDICFNTHCVGYCPFQEVQISPPPYQPYYSLEQDRIAKLEDTLVQFMQISIVNQKNTEASIKNLENQVGQLAQQIAEYGNVVVEAKEIEKENEEESEEEEKKSKKEENGPTLHHLPIPSSPPKVKREEDEVSFEEFDSISHHQHNDEILNVEHIDVVFGDRFDELTESNSSKNCKLAFIHMHVNSLACDLNVGELSWTVKRKKKKEFLMAWKAFGRTFDEIQVRRPKKRKGLYYNPCLWSP